ncbi:MAG: competence/damage-inducible protein A [Polyangiales bacterium]
MKTAGVLSIGTELTRGELTNTNASWLSAELTGIGLDVVSNLTVDDHPERIVRALDRLGAELEVLVVTGGLGPTTDDITAECVARVLGVGMERHEPTLESIRRRWAEFGRPMPESNVRQADVPAGAEVLPNSEGTAPGFAVTIGQARCFFMPGVPREMKAMFADRVVPGLLPRITRTTYQVHLRTFGLPESEVQDRLTDVEARYPGITLGYRAHFPEIEVKVFARAADATEAEALAARATEDVRAKLGHHVYGDRDDTFPGAVGRLLRNKGLTLAVAESCTGGMIGELVTSVPGSSEYLLLDAVCYANAAKEQVLGVPTDLLRAHGAVSAEVAQAMAEGALRISGADVAVSVTGIAGPGGGTEEKPVGTVWFAVATKGAERAVSLRKRLPGDRERVRTLASYIALELVARAARDGQPAAP